MGTKEKNLGEDLHDIMRIMDPLICPWVEQQEETHEYYNALAQQLFNHWLVKLAKDLAEEYPPLSE